MDDQGEFDPAARGHERGDADGDHHVSGNTGFAELIPGSQPVPRADARSRVGVGLVHGASAPGPRDFERPGVLVPGHQAYVAGADVECRIEEQPSSIFCLRPVG